MKCISSYMTISWIGFFCFERTIVELFHGRKNLNANFSHRLVTCRFLDHPQTIIDYNLFILSHISLMNKNIKRSPKLGP